jgi:hypothetical protein
LVLLLWSSRLAADKFLAVAMREAYEAALCVDAVRSSNHDDARRLFCGTDVGLSLGAVETERVRASRVIRALRKWVALKAKEPRQDILSRRTSLRE